MMLAALQIVVQILNEWRCFIATACDQFYMFIIFSIFRAVIICTVDYKKMFAEMSNYIRITKSRRIVCA